MTSIPSNPRFDAFRRMNASSSAVPQQTQSMMSGQQAMDQSATQEDLTPDINRFIDYADRNRADYIGNPKYVRQPSFGKAVSGIENGDFEGLEMLDFGALADGTPAVSFTDEDGQRQTIRMTMPQWLGAMQYRSQSRMELQRQRDLDAKRESFKPYFNMMAKKVDATNDPDIGGYLAAMYQMDPDMAMKQLGEFQRQQMRQDAETVTWRGKQVPMQFAKIAFEMEQRDYEQGNKAFDEAMASYQDQPYAAPLLQNIKDLRRKPSDYEIPSTATMVDHLTMQNAGPLPLVNLFHSMTKPMMSGLPEPITLPRRDGAGDYNMAELTGFLNNFNMVSQRLGWSPILATDEVGLSAIVDALDIANRSQGLANKVTPPPQRQQPISLQRQQMSNEAMLRREEMRMGGGQQQPEQQGDTMAQQEAAIAEAVSYVKVNPTEDDKAVLNRIIQLAADDARLEAATIYTPEQKAAIRRAAQIIYAHSRK